MKRHSVSPGGLRGEAVARTAGSGKRTDALGIAVILLVLWLTVFSPGRGEMLDYTVPPRPNDNFLEASFRLIISSGPKPINAVLVYIPGTDGDGRGIVADPKFLTLGEECHAAVLGCYYRGEGLSYDDPRGGSGRALDEALAYFAAKSCEPQISRVKLLFVGFSQGGIFTFNYVCWRPQRVEAFAALRAIFPSLPPQPESFRVPGLLAAGENDEAGRIRAIASAYGQAEGKNAKWALLLEKQSGHQIGRSFELASSFFEAICRGDSSTTPVRIDTQGKEAGDPAFRGTHSCWFPNREVADFWMELHRPSAWESLETLADTPRLQDFLTIQERPTVYTCYNGQSQVGSLCINSRNTEIALGRVTVTGEGFSLLGTSSSTPPIELKIAFAPRNMLWGQARGDVVITGELSGHEAGAVHAMIYALVSGPLTPIPSVAYLGVVTSGQAIDQTILLKPIQGGVRLTTIHSPEGVIVSVGPEDKIGNIPLYVHWLGGSHFGRMEGQITVSITAPLKGTLRIPVVGFVMPPRQHASGAVPEEPLDSKLSLRTSSFLVSFVQECSHAVELGFNAILRSRLYASLVGRAATTISNLVEITDL